MSDHFASSIDLIHCERLLGSLPDSVLVYLTIFVVIFWLTSKYFRDSSKNTGLFWLDKVTEFAYLESFI
jgi:hypothetical protein